MPFADLQSFAAELERQGQLKRVSVEVDPQLEITEIANRVMKMPSPEGPGGAPANLAFAVLAPYIVEPPAF